MFSKVIVLSLIALAAAKPQHPPAHQFPAGVNPALCPAFPNCDNALLHNPQQHQGHQGHWGAPAAPAAPHWAAPTQAPHWGAPAPQWNAPAPQWNAPAPQWNAPAAHAYNPAPANQLPAGDKYPAGVNPQSCPNYPYCDTAGGHAGAPQVAPLPGFTERQYPAGVSPHQCPNFPYCS